MSRLVRHSEPFSPDGNLSAEGFENLLGTPSLDLLAVLVREAVQNCCDATRPDPGTASVRLRIRTLTDAQCHVLREEIFHELAEEETAARYLRDVLWGAEPLRVLEIADYGTTGLGGPTRADRVAVGGETPDFVNFFRNIGAARDVEGGGGTYGYGKATLYRASRAHAIVVDTVATDGGRTVRRLMAAQMGRAVPGRLTGRHWWGVPTGDGKTVDPLTGIEARRLAERLGMPERVEGQHGLGTTIMIVAPHLPADPRTTLNALKEYLLWYFWPRMMASTEKGKRLEGWVALEQEEWERVPDPAQFPPLKLLCRAMDSVRRCGPQDVEGVKLVTIRLLRPARELGHLAIVSGAREKRRWLLPPPGTEEDIGNEEEQPVTSVIPVRLHHVALMRPAQLVVRYETGPEAPDPEHEWGGVFMCAKDEDIERAFAMSEPPAHDDWQPEVLPPRSRERRFVNVALRRIREHVSGLFNEAVPPSPVAEGPLAHASAALGRMLPGAQGAGAGRRRGRPGNPGGLQPFTQPRPHALRLDDKGNPVAEFVFEVRPDGRNRRLEGLPGIIIDGSIEKPDEATGVPEVLEWIGPDGSSYEGADIVPHTEGSWLVRVSIPGDVAVGLRLRDRTEDEP